MVKVRFAPSPTGYLHIGGARTAIFNWLFARQQKGQFLLRIEDTDRERSGSALIEAIFDGLKWLGIDWHDQPVYQSSRIAIYQDYAQRLLREGKAYRCFCSPEKIMSDRERAIQKKQQYQYDGACRNLPQGEIQARLDAGEKYAIRFLLPAGKTTFHDLLHGDISVDHKVLDDFIVMRSDGYPTYNLAVVIDDYELGITHVIRGDDHLSNTPKQVLVYQALGWNLPKFLHVPLIHGPDRRRLSKRHGATAVREYAEKGYLPDAVFNYLTLLGWSPGDDREIFSRQELVQRFSFSGLAKKSAIFDEQKLLWMNAQHIKRLSGEELFDKVTPLFLEAGLVKRQNMGQQKDYIIAVLNLLKSRSRLLTDFVKQVDYFFQDPKTFDPSGVSKHWQDPSAAERLDALANMLEKLPEWKVQEIEKCLRGLAEALNMSAAKLIHPARLAITGRTASPGMFEVMELVGREKVLHRLKKAVEIIRNNG